MKHDDKSTTELTREQRRKIEEDYIDYRRKLRELIIAVFPSYEREVPAILPTRLSSG